MYSKNRSDKSLCERSMQMVTNIVKLTSFSIAKAGLGTSGRMPSSKNLCISSGDDSDSLIVIVQRPPGSHQSQESSKPVSYLAEPTRWSTRKIHEEKTVDGMASDYIEKVHRKNRHHLLETPEDFPIILPPPPRMVK